jgi:hypothetical protein
MSNKFKIELEIETNMELEDTIKETICGMIDWRNNLSDHWNKININDFDKFKVEKIK